MSSSGTDNDGGTPFVLIPGIGMSHRYLTRLHDLLAHAGKVYSIDMPGFGGLPKPSEAVGIPEMARALGQVLDQLAIKRAVLIGHFMGTQWVVELATQRPQLATHVIAVGPVVDDKHRSIAAQAIVLAVDSLGEPLSGDLLVFSDYLRCGQSWFLSQMRHMHDYRIENRVGLSAHHF